MIFLNSITYDKILSWFSTSRALLRITFLFFFFKKRVITFLIARIVWIWIVLEMSKHQKSHSLEYSFSEYSSFSAYTIPFIHLTICTDYFDEKNIFIQRFSMRPIWNFLIHYLPLKTFTNKLKIWVF